MNARLITVLYWILVFQLPVGSLSAFWAVLEGDKPEPASLPAPGSPAPDFSVPSAAGAPVSKASLHGKAVLLHFWSASCGVCRAQLPFVRDLQRSLADRDLVVISASLDADCSAADLTARQQGISWVNVCDGKGREGALAKAFAVTAVPATRLIDREGTVAGNDLSPARLRVAAAEVATETHAGRYSRESRREISWKVDEIFRAMALRPGSRVADIGAGEGFTSVRLSPEVGPDGKVYAVDIDDRVLGELRERSQKAGLSNMEVVRGKTSDPMLPPESLDAVLVLRSYHEFTYHREMLAKIRAALKPGGRLVVVDAEPGSDDHGRDREWQVRQHLMTLRVVEGELSQAGFRLVKTADPFATPAGRETLWLIGAEKQMGNNHPLPHGRGSDAIFETVTHAPAVRPCA